MSCKDCGGETQGDTCAECDEQVCDDCAQKPDPFDTYCKECSDDI